jgi:hypothetical protein
MGPGVDGVADPSFERPDRFFAGVRVDPDHYSHHCSSIDTAEVRTEAGMSDSRSVRRTRLFRATPRRHLTLATSSGSQAAHDW